MPDMRHTLVIQRPARLLGIHRGKYLPEFRVTHDHIPPYTARSQSMDSSGCSMPPTFRSRLVALSRPVGFRGETQATMAVKTPSLTPATQRCDPFTNTL